MGRTRRQTGSEPEAGTVAMKKILGILGILAAVGAVVAFFRREEDDDEFLDEELP